MPVVEKMPVVAMTAEAEKENKASLLFPLSLSLPQKVATGTAYAYLMHFFCRRIAINNKLKNIAVAKK